jgi:hypothetical protein
VLKARHVDIVNPKVRPIERRLDRLECGRLVHFMNFGHIKRRLRAVDLLEISNDFQDGRFGSVEVQAGDRMEGISPRRGQEDNDTMLRRMFVGAYQILVTTLNKLDRSLEVRDVARRQVKDGRLDLETDAFRSRQVPEDSVESIARSGEWIDDADGPAAGGTRDNFGDIFPDLIAERIFHSFKACARENTHTALVPFLWRHAIKVNVVRVIEAVSPVLLDLPQLDQLISLLRTEKEVAIVLSIRMR